MAARKRVKGTKYQKVTKQQKYIFLNLAIAEQKSIQEAAFQAGIHYSTAKTILFFHKRQYKNYASYSVNTPQTNQALLRAPRATYAPIHIELDSNSASPQRIEVISRMLFPNAQKKGEKIHKKRVGQMKGSCMDQQMVKIQEQWSQGPESRSKDIRLMYQQGRVEKRRGLPSSQ